MNEKPNILFIFSDQHRQDCMGASNKNTIITPNLDALASQGISFENAFTPIPLCCPSRQSLLNARRPETFGALWNYDNAFKVSCLSPQEYSWPRELKDNGYTNIHVGKWHVNPDYGPVHFGFDYCIGDNEYNKFLKNKYPEKIQWSGWLGDKNPIPLEDSHTHWLADKTIDMIRKCSDEDKPWHISVEFSEPHLPYRPSLPFSEMYNPEDMVEWGSFKDDFKDKPYIQMQQLHNWECEDFTWKDWAPAVTLYFGIISQMDDAVGLMINELDKLGLSENTLVIYSTDHGDMCGAHRMVDKHYILYDDVVKVPMIIRWPKLIKPGQKCKNFVYSCLDIPPTILDILGIEKKEFFHGRSMLPILEGNVPADWRTQVVSTYNGQQFGLYTQRMLRDSKWKYIWNCTDTDELYDLENDPYELTNLIHHQQSSDVAADMRKRLLDELVRVDDPIVTRSHWMRNQLLGNRKL